MEVIQLCMYMYINDYKEQSVDVDWRFSDTDNRIVHVGIDM